MTVLLFLIGSGCSTETPLPLPEQQRTTWRAKGRMVAAADLRGYLVMPQSTPAPGTLLLVETIDASWRDTADTMAVGGEVVLLLPTTVDTARGEQYLTHLAATRGIRTLCKRTDCP